MMCVFQYQLRSNNACTLPCAGLKPTYFLRAFLRVKGDIPAVIVCKLTSDIGWTLWAGKQLSDVLGSGSTNSES